MSSTPFYALEKSPLSERFTVVSLVVLAHLAVLSLYLLRTEPPAVLINEMSISFSNEQQVQQAEVPPAPPVPVVKPRETEPEHVPSDTPVAKEEVAVPVPQQATPATPAPVHVDTEPDYKADYLNNPRPPYPMVAKKMGYQGTVVLDVEVLADGTAGEVTLHKSSGYKVLDNAALAVVKTWRFTPGKHMGVAVTKHWFVPYKFLLKGNEE